MTKNFDTTTVKGRLLTFLHYKRISQSEFARNMNVAPTYISAMRKSMSPERLGRLMELYPDLNRDWLLYGTGEMILPDKNNPLHSIESFIVPLLPVAAFAGNMQMWSQGVMMHDCQRIVSPIADVDCAIRISGDSMEPEFHDGSTLFLRRIHHAEFIPWGQPMVVDSSNGVIVKCLYPHTDNSIEARSLNPAYPPLHISKDTIYGIYRIVGCMKYYTTV